MLQCVKCRRKFQAKLNVKLYRYFVATVYWGKMFNMFFLFLKINVVIYFLALELIAVCTIQRDYIIYFCLLLCYCNFNVRFFFTLSYMKQFANNYHIPNVRHLLSFC